VNVDIDHVVKAIYIGQTNSSHVSTLSEPGKQLRLAQSDPTANRGNTRRYPPPTLRKSPDVLECSSAADFTLQTDGPETSMHRMSGSYVDLCMWTGHSDRYVTCWCLLT
jgi:hypothetical protein